MHASLFPLGDFQAFYGGAFTEGMEHSYLDNLWMICLDLELRPDN